MSDSHRHPSPQGDVANLNWILIKPNCLPFIIHIPRKLYEGPSQNCQPLFIDELRRRCGVIVDEAHILLWVPKATLSVYDAAQPGWARSVDDFHAHFKNVVPPIALSKQVTATENQELVHPVVTIQDRGQVDIYPAPELKEFKRYEKTVSTPGRTPSQGATLTGYRKVQADTAQAIYDGRRASTSSISTIGTPIQIFHPIFSEFVSQVLDPKVQPTVDDLKIVQDFMYSLSVVGREEGWHWRGYNEGLLKNLERILRAEVHEEPYPDGTKPDGVLALEIGNAQVVYLIIELKRELGEGGYDPTIQAGLSMKRSWIDRSRQPVRERCCCPTFLIGGGGPWLSVLGGVFTDRFIVQRLTDMKWMALSSTEEDSRVYHNARVLVALRESLVKLRHFYLNQVPSAPSFAANHPHPRYFPYPTSFMADDGRRIHLQYLKSLDEDPACVTYLAEIVNESMGRHASPTKIVVKFVGRYGKAAHEFLALHDWAPALHYCGPLPGSNLVDFISGPAQNAPPGLCLHSDTMHMVVMDYIQPRPNAPKDVLQQIHSILRLLHSEGYVFGDLRKQNILFDTKREGRVKLIDFNWCGRFDIGICDDPTATSKLPEGLQSGIDVNRERVDARDARSGTSGVEYAYYPLSMWTVDGMWASGMEPLALVRPQHDWMMFDRLCWV